MEIFENFKAFIDKNLPNYVSYSLTRSDVVEGVKIDLNNKYMKEVLETLKEVYQNEAEINFVGGTLPIMNAIKDNLNIPILGVPLAQEDCGMHSPNERLTELAFEKGVEFSIKYLTKIGSFD